MVVNELAAQRDMTLVCVNRCWLGRARETEGLHPGNKSR